MRSHRATELGLVSTASALLLGLLRLALPYLWDAVFFRGSDPTILGQSLRAFWIPLSADILLVATALVGVVGFVMLWRGRWDFGPDYASRVGLALLAVLVAGIALALWAATGLLLGSFPGFSGLVPWRNLLAFAGTGFLGLALYWVLAHLPLQGARPVAAVAFALGVTGGVLSLVSTPALRRAQVVGIGGAALALSAVSIVLWVVLCVWSSQSLRAGRSGSRAATPTRDA